MMTANSTINFCKISNMLWSLRSDVGCKYHQTSSPMTPSYVTDEGYRMEDAHAVTSTRGGVVMCIADGHGSVEHAPSVHLGGNESAECAAKYIVSRKSQIRTDPVTLFHQAQDHLRQNATSIGDRVSRSHINDRGTLLVTRSDNNKTVASSQGATLTCVRLSWKFGIMCASIGDTSAILIHADGTYDHMTELHNRSNLSELRRVTSAGAKKVGRSYMAYKMSNGEEYYTQVTRAFGHYGNSCILQTPYVYHSKLQKGDVVVVATDGLWDYVTVDKVVDLVLKERNPDAICDTLIDMSKKLCPDKKKGRRDNVTVGAIVVPFKRFTVL